MPASSGIRLGRLVHEECLAAIEALDSDQNVHLRIHQARKAIRRARSLIALVARELDTGTADGILQRTGESLGALRVAHAAALTAARMDRRCPDPGWAPAAAALMARADRLARRELALDPSLARRRRAIARARRQLEALPWDTLSAASIKRGLARQAQRVEKATRRSRQDRSPENQHRLRRRVRRLRMQVDALAGLGIPVHGHHPPTSARLRRLSDALGREHDRVVLVEALRRTRRLDRRAELLRLLNDDAQPAPTATASGLAARAGHGARRLPC